MFLWTWRQAAFLLLMIVVCAMALIYPAWRHWYEIIFPPLFLLMLIMAIGYVIRK